MAALAKRDLGLGLVLSCHYDLYFRSKIFVLISSLHNWNINDSISVLVKLLTKVDVSILVFHALAKKN